MYKTDFPYFEHHPELIYLDSAASTHKPRVVIERVAQFYEQEYAPAGRGLYEPSLVITEKIETVREQVMRFLDSPADDQVVFTDGATDALNLLAHGIPFEEGDEIILSEAEHHANLVPWQEAARAKNVRVLFVRTHKNGQLDLEQLGEMLSEKTRVVSLSLVSNVFGTILPVGEITNLLDRQGSRPFFILDASQAAAHIPLSVRTLGCDALVLAGHKMYAPNGVGVLWGRASLLEGLAPYRTGGAMIDRVTLPESTWAPLPARLEAGSPNSEGILGLGAAIAYLETIGMDTVKQHTTEVHQALQPALTIPGIFQVGEPDPASGILSLMHESIHPHDLAQFLADSSVCVRAGHQCAQPLHAAHNLPGSLRASIGLYNTPEDATRFVKTLREAVQFFCHD